MDAEWQDEFVKIREDIDTLRDEFEMNEQDAELLNCLEFHVDVLEGLVDA